MANIVGGIGTDFSNGCSNFSALNIVIKLTSVNGKEVVKLSDDKGKHTGNEKTIQRVKEELEIL